ncbi:sjoegren syndrome/scleroderma autoantigen 1, partial [Kipferlia bialata]
LCPQCQSLLVYKPSDNKHAMCTACGESTELATSPPAKYMDRRSQIPKVIAGLLQQGWALIDKTCPSEDCSAPLVRNKDGQVYCPECGSRVLTQDQADALGVEPGSVEPVAEREREADTGREAGAPSLAGLLGVRSVAPKPQVRQEERERETIEPETPFESPSGLSPSGNSIWPYWESATKAAYNKLTEAISQVDAVTSDKLLDIIERLRGLEPK